MRSQVSQLYEIKHSMLHAPSAWNTVRDRQRQPCLLNASKVRTNVKVTEMSVGVVSDQERILPSLQVLVNREKMTGQALNGGIQCSLAELKSVQIYCSLGIYVQQLTYKAPW